MLIYKELLVNLKDGIIREWGVDQVYRYVQFLLNSVFHLGKNEERNGWCVELDEEVQVTFFSCRTFCISGYS